VSATTTTTNAITQKPLTEPVSMNDSRFQQSSVQNRSMSYNNNQQTNSNQRWVMELFFKLFMCGTELYCMSKNDRHDDNEENANKNTLVFLIVL
jgi:hypothetical protein